MGGLVIPLFVFIVTGTLLVSAVPAADRRVRSTLDRLVLGLLVGMALYMLGATVLNALFRVRLTALSLSAFFFVTSAGMGIAVWKRRANPFGERHWSQLITLAGLLLILALAVNDRLQNTLLYPTRLLDADPYRHHDRTRQLIETGHLSPWDSHIYGKVPVLEMQGCYTLPAVISLLSGVDAWHLWQFGALVVGSLSVLGTYLLAKYSFRGNSAAGVAAAAFLAASPIHILRTNMGFSEAYGLPFLAPALLFFLFLTDDLRYGHAFFFGTFYTALAMANPIPAAFLVPVLVIYTAFVFIEKRGRWRLLAGIAISAAMFFGMVGIWAATYLGVSPAVGAKITSGQGTEGISKEQAGETARKLFKENVGVVVPAIAILGIVAMFVDRRRRVDKAEVYFPHARVFYVLLFLIYVAYAALVRTEFHTPGLVQRLAHWFFALFKKDFRLPAEFSIPSFTSKIYRYFLLPSWAASMLAGWAAAAGCDGAGWLASRVAPRLRKYIVTSLYVVAIGLIAGVYSARPDVWGRWGMNCTEEEYQAADWINAHTSQDALIITHWYTGDYIRSLTARRIVLIDAPYGSLRPEMRALNAMGKLDIPMLASKEPAGILQFSSEHSEEVYVLTSQWQGVRDFPEGDGFTELVDTKLQFDFGGETKPQDRRLRIFRVEKDGKTKEADVAGNLAFGAVPMGECSNGTVKNLEKLNDGWLGENRKDDAALTDPVVRRFDWAWFGLDFGKERRVSSIFVAFGMYAQPKRVKKPELHYIPVGYKFQYWKNGEWVDFPDGEFVGMDMPVIDFSFRPVTTQKIRVLITRTRNDAGNPLGGWFRAAVLELAAYTPIQ